MKYPWSASRSTSSASSDPEAGDTPLADMPRHSTETQRRNGFRQSTHPDHGERILEDIRNGNYTCSICLDPITPGNANEHSIWHCPECYNVNHFRCAKSWAEASSRNAILSALLALGKWKCPSCAVECPEPKAQCWCQKRSFGLLDPLSSERPNACLDTCDRASTCPHGERKPCLKLCHPGPCNVPKLTASRFAGGPDIAWYNQMKSTCNGFNTRVAMYTTGKYEVKSLSPNIPSYDMYLGSHLKPILKQGAKSNANATHHFEFYQRLSISRPNPASPDDESQHLAIDVDIPNSLYRIMKLNKSDTVNEYLAYNYKDSATNLPTFHPVSEALISVGSFTAVSATQKHMFIPGLNIGIANMHQFIHDYDQEPFVKIYQNLSPYWRTSIAGGPPTLLPAEQDLFRKTLNEPWDSKNGVPLDHQLIMRTASFGHGRQRLDMCIQEDGGEKGVSVGVYKDMWVPFAIMASWKQRMYEQSLKEEES
ncbi:hypothetical protein BGZ57DRAFT_818243 [Hyaloscypha finlandica]|nr:hypothetical protein BGZ57DRAFT_818243 [Hyaloscypha finlandica]